MIDRFQLTLGHWRVTGTRSDLAEGFSLLSGHEVTTATGEHVPLFKSREFRSDRWKHELDIRGSGRGRGTLGLRPLLSGKLVARIRGGNPFDSGSIAQAQIQLEGSWNLSRFIQAFELRTRTRLDRPRSNGQVPLAIASNNEHFCEERPLILDDNVILGKASRYGFALSRPVEVFLADYVSGFAENLSQAMLDRNILALEGYSSAGHELNDFRLGDIEFYWEFSHARPINLVDTLTHFLPRAAVRMRVTRKQLDRMHREVSQQSQCATIYLSRNRQVKVYAKTSRRIRFEVTFPSGYRSESHRVSTFASLVDLTHAVAQLKLEASETLNSVFENLWAVSSPQDHDPTPDQLRRKIVDAAENPLDAETIISALALHGRIAMVAGDGLRPAIRKLAGQGVLETRQVSRDVYVATRPYNYAVRNLLHV
ncbi:hypothetical protein O2N63_13050 [Aliiroseovarius sp. KMU-50]|uniref:Uncharacterized protein n=1 Tax=Aliiroseovarius salicola TaxID=3009082 RepID=A0ABT4W3A7_9RHOB|nr:hypothetical protein [Aliiroseovarius sp. KMU-50]MDA5095011.1 hypothetical protein [Aliiroseovarius sp. KMU-50]